MGSTRRPSAVRTAPRHRVKIAAAVLAGLLTATTISDPLPASAQTPAEQASAVARPRPSKAKRPTVKRISPDHGLVTGGTQITIRGKNFTRVKSVVFGDQPGTDLDVVNSKKLRVTAPVGLAGQVRVRVVNRAGRSKTTRQSRYTYQDPATRQDSTLVPRDDTVSGTNIAWVTSTEPDGGPAPDSGPWLVGIDDGGVVPSVGDGYYVPAGTPAFPSGLTGRVSVIASQPDGITTATVEPEPVSELMETIGSAQVGTGLGTEVTPPEADARVDRPTQRRDVTSNVNFPNLTSSFFSCQNSANQSVSFGGSVDLSIDNVSHDFEVDKGNLFAKPYASAWIRADITLSGTVSVAGKVSCKLRDDWAKANARQFLIGEFLVKIRPEATFSVSGKAALKVTQRTRRMAGFTIFDNHPNVIDVRKNLGLDVSAGDLSATVRLEAGIGVKVLYLGTAGVELKLLLAGQGKITVKAQPRRACVDLEFGVRFVGSLVIDLWIKDWTPVSYSKLFTLASWQRCGPPIDSPVIDDPPTITTTRLPSAVRGRQYAALLETADGRSGVWTVQAARFPIGLTLDTSGQISGTPTGGVGDYRFLVTFTDDQGQRTNQNVALYIGPPPPVGGGDIQATLTWGHYADMDLWVTDPDGETVYWQHPASASGGQLDRDANAGCGEQNPSPVENVYWPPGGAPTGTYAVQVVTYSDCDTLSQPWHLTVRVRGAVVLSVDGNGTSDAYLVNVGATRGRFVGREPAKQFRVGEK